MGEQRAAVKSQLSKELCNFKYHLLCEDKEVIIGASNKIELFVVIFEALISILDGASDLEIERLYERDNLLESYYEAWMEDRGDLYSEVEQYLRRKLILGV